MRLTSKIVFRVLNILVITTYVFFRIYNSLLVTPFFDNYDSPQYFKFSIFPSFRMQGITFFYSLIQNENGIVIFQTLIGIIVTIYLWSIINSTIHYNLLKFIFKTSVPCTVQWYRCSLKQPRFECSTCN